jgi:hypothetical protein
VRGRTAHESIFNLNDGEYRCPNSQQGYSPFSTWTRGLAWAICGFAEQLEFFAATDQTSKHHQIVQTMETAARATADFYIEHSCTDGVPIWDTGAPHLHRLRHYADKPSDPYNEWEPVDSSAAAIAGQGLLRLGNYLIRKGDKKQGGSYRLAALTIAETIFDEPYLSGKARHQGLILHSVYHRPNGWDHVAKNQKVPNGESSMWGDYHARELGLMLWREAHGQPYLTFFRCAQT